jgi:hypothetical protein
LKNKNPRKSTEVTPPVKEQNAFNHALYVLVTHWATFVVMLGLLTTIGSVFATTSVPLSSLNRKLCAFVILGVFVGSCRSLYRIEALWNWMVRRELLSADYIATAATGFLHPWPAGLAALGLAVWDWWLLFHSK